MEQSKINRYLANKGNICPHCDSNDLITGSFDADENSAWQRIECGNCGKQWNDIYTLGDVEDIDCH